MLEAYAPVRHWITGSRNGTHHRTTLAPAVADLRLSARASTYELPCQKHNLKHLYHRQPFITAISSIELYNDHPQGLQWIVKPTTIRVLTPIRIGEIASNGSSVTSSLEEQKSCAKYERACDARRSGTYCHAATTKGSSTNLHRCASSETKEWSWSSCTGLEWRKGHV